MLAFFGLYLAHRLFGLNPLNLFGDEDESEGDDDDTPTIGTAAKLMKQAAGNDEPVERPDTKFDDVKGLGEVREQLEQVKDYGLVFKMSFLGYHTVMMAFLGQKREFRTFFGSKHVILGHFGSKKSKLENYFVHFSNFSPCSAVFGHFRDDFAKPPCTS